MKNFLGDPMIFLKSPEPVDFDEFHELWKLFSAFLNEDVTPFEKFGDEGLGMFFLDDAAEEILEVRLIDNPINRFAMLLCRKYPDDFLKYSSVMKRILGLYEIMQSARASGVSVSKDWVKLAAGCKANVGDQVFDEDLFFTLSS
jgi:hypothetical protein